LPKCKSKAVSSAASLANGRALTRSVSDHGWAHFKFGHRAEAAVRGFASGALDEAATEALKLLVGVGVGVGQLPRTTYASGPTCSMPSQGIRPKLAFATAAVAKLNWKRPSWGTEILIVLSLSPTSKKEGESWLGR
jgi:hypothetical protein